MSEKTKMAKSFRVQFTECVKDGFTKHVVYRPVECKRFGGMCHAAKTECKKLRES